MECTRLFNFACTAVHLHHCTKWACAHLKPPLPVSFLLCAVASQNLSQNASRDVAWRFSHQHNYFCTALFLFTRPRSIFLNHKVRSLLLAASLRGGVSLSMLLAVLFAPEMLHLLARNVALLIIYLYFQSFCSLKKHFLFFGIQISELLFGSVIV